MNYLLAKEFVRQSGGLRRDLQYILTSLRYQSRFAAKKLEMISEHTSCFIPNSSFVLG
jgi:hypothetical protein